MSFPLVLLQPRVTNESQDEVLDTVKLFPNSSNNVQSRFVLPRQGTMLDSNSCLNWNVSWKGYDKTKIDNDQLVLLKNSSGGLNTLLRARFYVGSKLIFSSEDCGAAIHVKKLSFDPDYRCEVHDMELGSENSYFTGTLGKTELGNLGKTSTRLQSNLYTRLLGSYSEISGEDASIQCSVKLSDMFTGLKSVQLPISELEECRVEIDWETGFDEVAYVFKNRNDTLGEKTIEIKNPTLLLDYLTLETDKVMALRQTMADGVPLPFVHTSVSEKQITANASVATVTTDVLLALQGKLLMKMYVSHRLSDSAGAGNDLQGYAKGCGRLRSQRNDDFSYNLYVNDLALHDQPVDSATMAYSFLEMTEQRPVSIFAGNYDKNESYTAIANTDVVSEIYNPCGEGHNVAGGGMTPQDIKNMSSGTQAYIGFDLSKYDEGSAVVPSNAGYRVGSSAVILRIAQAGSATATAVEAKPKVVQVFTEEVRILQMRGGQVDVFEA